MRLTLGDGLAVPTVGLGPEGWGGGLVALAAFGLEKPLDRYEDVLVPHEEVADDKDKGVAVEPLRGPVAAVVAADHREEPVQLKGLANAGRSHVDAVLLNHNLCWCREQGACPEVDEQVLGLDRSVVPLCVLVEPGNGGLHFDNVRPRCACGKVLHDLPHGAQPLRVVCLNTTVPDIGAGFTIAHSTFCNDPARHPCQRLRQLVPGQSADHDYVCVGVLCYDLQVAQENWGKLREKLRVQP
mmetsp:Transcript_39779/g.89745  ORF Transcript_39779/g.89745 Transcript_39779/m.89745 type:complete len:241 (+) Transcript_39779:419-1141(+)